VASLSNPFPFGLNRLRGPADGALTGASTTFSAILYNTPLSYVQQWNLDIQRELPGNMVVDAAYVGNHGLKLPVNENVDSLNTAFYGAIGDSNRVEQLNALVPNPFSGQVKTGTLSAGTVQYNQLLRQFPQYLVSDGEPSAGGL